MRQGGPLADGSLPPAGSRQWVIRLLTPTAHPLDALAAVLTQDSESVTAVIDMQAALSQNGRALTLAAQQILARQNSPHLLLVIDQFEEPVHPLPPAQRTSGIYRQPGNSNRPRR
ncbi:MAG: hypothetical protein M5U34_40450 [Chloroflexi bacterium]|nr:hypothetical protein [Chloroflexota bacterium]